MKYILYPDILPFVIIVKKSGSIPVHVLIHQRSIETPSSKGGSKNSLPSEGVTISLLMKPAAHRRVAHRKMPTASRNSRGIVETIPIESL